MVDPLPAISLAQRWNGVGVVGSADQAHAVQMQVAIARGGVRFLGVVVVVQERHADAVRAGFERSLPDKRARRAKLERDLAAVSPGPWLHR